MDVVLSAAVIAFSVVLTAMSAANLRWMLYAWSSPAAYESVDFAADSQGVHPIRLGFSLILPCRDEPEHVMRATVDRLLAQRYDDFEVIISVGHDDAATTAVAERIASEDSRVRVSVNHDECKNKPRQLNTALALCTKDIVGIVDAESLTDPGLLRGVASTFAAADADVVQGAVQLVNHRDRWFTLRNCLEYRTWFRSRLHSYARDGFVPLGGNTVFVRRELLLAVDGWDGNCLAEDCDLGVRLSVLGKKIHCAYRPELTTREEAPTTLASFLKQRTRWTMGFLQVLAKGDWRQLPTRRERAGAWWTLVQQFSMAITGLALPVAIVTALFANLPILVVLIAFVPLLTMMLTLAFEVLVLREMGRDLALPVAVRDYALLGLSLPFYQVLLAIAALRATWRYIGGEFAWEKTVHTGSHHPVALPGRVRVDEAA